MRKYVWKQWLCAAALTALVLSGCGQKASAAGNIPDTAMTTEPVEDTAGADMTKGKADGPEDQADVQSSASIWEGGALPFLPRTSWSACTRMVPPPCCYCIPLRRTG